MDKFMYPRKTKGCNYSLMTWHQRRLSLTAAQATSLMNDYIKYKAIEVINYELILGKFC